MNCTKITFKISHFEKVWIKLWQKYDYLKRQLKGIEHFQSSLHCCHFLDIKVFNVHFGIKNKMFFLVCDCVMFCLLRKNKFLNIFCEVTLLSKINNHPNNVISMNSTKYFIIKKYTLMTFFLFTVQKKEKRKTAFF